MMRKRRKVAGRIATQEMKTTDDAPTAKTNLMATHKSYLLLGEGDFTYSLDMCRYLASLYDEREAAACATTETAARILPSYISITCTGVDTHEELRGKYKDIDFILRNIKSFGANQEDDGENKRMVVETTTLHSINAVQAECIDKDENNSIYQNFDHVIFNHPHLAIEDAQLHSRFLQHLFHASTKRWMKPGTGLLHLTLVNGQCSRWKCLEGAKKHGLVLIRRGKFCPPPPPGGQTYYSLRRHQSGKSFANRRRMQGEESSCHGFQNESETLVFGRACDFSGDDIATNNIGLLPWEIASQKDVDSKTTTAPSGMPPTDDINTHPCQYCSKSFQEHRSLKNHMFSSHPDCDEVCTWKLEKSKKRNKKRKLKNDGEGQFLDINDGDTSSTRQFNPNTSGSDNTRPPWICTICESQHGTTQTTMTSSQEQQQPARIFPHQQALLDHQRAKHFGAYVNIKPDWYRNETGGNNTACNNVGPATSGESVTIGSCPICDLPYSTELDKIHHEMEFLPSSSSANTSATHATSNGDGVQLKSNQFPHKCSYCPKTFRELRARRQHENFCSLTK